MPAYFPDIASALDLVVVRLRGVGLETAIDPSDLNPPGVWVKFAGFGTDVLSGATLVHVEVACVVGAQPLPEAYRALVDVADEVVEELGHPDGPVRAQATTFGNDPVALPTLVLPYDVEA